jgi:hypothetical protein
MDGLGVVTGVVIGDVVTGIGEVVTGIGSLGMWVVGIGLTGDKVVEGGG